MVMAARSSTPISTEVPDYLLKLFPITPPQKFCLQPWRRNACGALKTTMYSFVAPQYQVFLEKSRIAGIQGEHTSLTISGVLMRHRRLRNLFRNPRLISV